MRRATRAGSRGRRGVLVLLALPFAVSAMAFVPATSADEIAEARERQRELQRQITEQVELIDALDAEEAELEDALAVTKSALQETHADLRVVRGQVAENTRRLRAVEARYARLVAQIRHLDWTLGVLEDEADRREQDLEDRRRTLAQRLAEAYRTQQTTMLEQVVNADSFTEVLSDVGSYMRLGDQDAALAQQIERDQEVLEQQRRMTAGTRYRTDQLRREAHRQEVMIRRQRAALEASRQRLEQLEAETKRLQQQQLAEYRATIRSEEQARLELERHEAAEEQLRKDIERLIEEARKREEARLRELMNRVGGQTTHGTGDLRWPMIGRISQEYGCTGFAWEGPKGDCPHFHDGIDIVAPAGTPVHAAAAGTIAYAGFNPHDPPDDPAWIVIIAHEGGMTTWYAHMQGRRPEGVRYGAHVAAGQLIGWAGNTGKSTGVHLHWQVDINGQTIDPRRLT